MERRGRQATFRLKNRCGHEVAGVIILDPVEHAGALLAGGNKAGQAPLGQVLGADIVSQINYPHQRFSLHVQPLRDTLRFRPLKRNTKPLAHMCTRSSAQYSPWLLTRVCRAPVPNTDVRRDAPGQQLIAVVSLASQIRSFARHLSTCSADRALQGSIL